MFFDDWPAHGQARISKSLLWEYDLSSPEWDWHTMRHIVVARVIELGRPEDYYAMFRLYGGVEAVREIVKTIPYMNDRDMEWCCVLFKLKREDLWSSKRALLRKQLSRSWQNS